MTEFDRSTDVHALLGELAGHAVALQRELDAQWDAAVASRGAFLRALDPLVADLVGEAVLPPRLRVHEHTVSMELHFRERRSRSTRGELRLGTVAVSPLFERSTAREHTRADHVRITVASSPWPGQPPPSDRRLP